MVNVIFIDTKAFDVYLFAEEVLKAHNAYRHLHNAPSLVLNEQLCIQSQKYAEDLLLFEIVDESKYSNVGENTYIIDTTNPDYHPKGIDPVNAWYHVSDARDQDYRNDVNFTQVVWKSTRHLGVGLARSENRIVIVCQYLPPGNVEGEYWQNVMPVMNDIDELNYGEDSYA